MSDGPTEIVTRNKTRGDFQPVVLGGPVATVRGTESPIRFVPVRFAREPPRPVGSSEQEQPQ